MGTPNQNKKNDKKASKCKPNLRLFCLGKVKNKKKGESFLFQHAKQGKKEALKRGGKPGIGMLSGERRSEENLVSDLQDARDLIAAGHTTVEGACAIYPDIQDALEIHGDIEKALEARKKVLSKLNEAISAWHFHDAQMRKHGDEGDKDEDSNGPSGGVGFGNGAAGAHGGTGGIVTI
jgi:hypothetical protein